MQTSSQEKPTHEQTKWTVLYPDCKPYEMYEKYNQPLHIAISFCDVHLTAHYF